MATTLGIRVQFDALRSLAHGSISASYAAVGTAFTNPIRIIKFYNATDVDLTISFDGTNDHDILKTGTTQTYEYCANRSMPSGVLQQAIGTTVYVKGAPTSGSFYVTAIAAVGA